MGYVFSIQTGVCTSPGPQACQTTFTHLEKTLRDSFMDR